MTDWGKAMYVTPGIVVDGELVTTNLVDINLGIRILLGSSFYERLGERGAVRHPRPARQPGRHAPPVEPDDAARAAEARLRRQVQLGDEPALVRQAHRRPPRARHRRRPVRPALHDGAGRAGGHAVRASRPARSVQITLPRSADAAGDDAGVAIPPWSNAHRARPGPGLLHRLRRGDGAVLRRGGAGAGCAAATSKVFQDLRGARRGDRLRLPRGGARRAVPPPGDPRRARSPTTTPTRRRRGTAARATATARPGPTRTPCRTCRSSRRTARTTSRASTSCAPCAASTRACRAACTCTSATAGPSRQMHSPMFGASHG